MPSGSRYWTTVVLVWAAHVAATMALTHAHTGFSLFTIPVVLPLSGAESWVGRALWLFLVDAGAVALLDGLVTVSMRPRRARARVGSEATPGPDSPPKSVGAVGPLGHLMLAAGLVLVSVALVGFRDEVFVIGVIRPTVSGIFGVVQRRIFSAEFAAFVPWVLVGGVIDIARHLVFVATDSPKTRLAVRTLSRTVTAAVLLRLALAPVFNVGQLAEGGASSARMIETLAALGLTGLGVAACLAAVTDLARAWRLAGPGGHDLGQAAGADAGVGAEAYAGLDARSTPGITDARPEERDDAEATPSDG